MELKPFIIPGCTTDQHEAETEGMILRLADQADKFTDAEILSGITVEGFGFRIDSDRCKSVEDFYLLIEKTVRDKRI